MIHSTMFSTTKEECERDVQYTDVMLIFLRIELMTFCWSEGFVLCCIGLRVIGCWLHI